MSPVGRRRNSGPSFVGRARAGRLIRENIRRGERESWKEKGGEKSSEKDSSHNSGCHHHSIRFRIYICGVGIEMGEAIRGSDAAADSVIDADAIPS